MYRQPPPDQNQNPNPKPGTKSKRTEAPKPESHPADGGWTSVALKPEALELVDLKLPDDSTCIGAWTGRIWWTREGTVNPVQWRKRPDAVFASLIMK